MYRLKTAAQAFSGLRRSSFHDISSYKENPPGAAHRLRFSVMSKLTHNPQTLPPVIHIDPESITLQAAAEPTRKRRGEAAEAAFLARATALGFSVLIPWGDSDRYDSVVELNHGLLRVQVKSATLYAENRYRVKTTGASGRVYTSKEIDFFVGYVVPENIWYIIPIQAIGRRKGVRFYPPHPPPVPRHVREIPRSLVPPRLLPKRPPPQRRAPPLPQQASGT